MTRVTKGIYRQPVAGGYIEYIHCLADWQAWLVTHEGTQVTPMGAGKTLMAVRKAAAEAETEAEPRDENTTATASFPAVQG